MEERFRRKMRRKKEGQRMRRKQAGIISTPTKDLQEAEDCLAEVREKEEEKGRGFCINFKKFSGLIYH